MASDSTSVGEALVFLAGMCSIICVSGVGALWGIVKICDNRLVSSAIWSDYDIQSSLRQTNGVNRFPLSRTTLSGMTDKELFDLLNDVSGECRRRHSA